MAPVRTWTKRKAQVAEASSDDEEFDGALLEGVLSGGEDEYDGESFDEDCPSSNEADEDEDNDDSEEDEGEGEGSHEDIVNGDMSSDDEGFVSKKGGVRSSTKAYTASDSGVDTAGPTASREEAQIAEADDENGRPDFRVATDANGGVRYEYPEIEPGYDSEDSDRGGDGENTIGDIPLSFYDAYPHLGYNINGRKVMRPATTEAIDALLDSIETPAGFTGLVDPQTGKPLELSRDELELLKKLQLNEIPEDMELYPDQVEWFSTHTMSHPLSSAPEPKRRFVPSKHEAKRVMKIVRAIREGRILPHKPPQDDEEVYFDIWANEEARPPHVMNLVAPKPPPPGFEESYRPPKEYIPDDEEKAKWEQSEPEERERNFLPTSHSSLRLVPAYSSFIYERFQRSLDLYMAPRISRRKLRMDPQDLLPKLPRPEDLKPFPSVAQTIFNHGCRVRTVSFSPDGYLIATGADDGLARVWSINGHLEWSAKLSSEAAVDAVQWRPHKETFILAAAVAEDIFLMVPPCAGNVMESASREALNAGFGHAVAEVETTATGARKEPAGRWHRPSARLQDVGVLLKITVQSVVKTLSWHRRGEYLASVSPAGKRNAVAIHTLSRHQTQLPFRKIPGSAPQAAKFHPSRPLFFVATQRAVRVYDLQRQELVKILQPGSRWISSIDVHPAGDNVIVGGYDRRLAWIDMDLSPRPYKTLRYHDKAIRVTKFHHGGLPLFADCSDDGTIEVYHGRVVADLMTNATLVPLKQLRGHKVVDSLGVMDIDFHPREAWIVSAGADGTVRLWCN